MHLYTYVLIYLHTYIHTCNIYAVSSLNLVDSEINFVDIFDAVTIYLLYLHRCMFGCRRIQLQYDHLDKEYREHALGALLSANTRGSGKVSLYFIVLISNAKFNIKLYNYFLINFLMKVAVIFYRYL